MSDIQYIQKVSGIHKMLGLPAPQHPLISVYYHKDLQDQGNDPKQKISADLFMIAMKDGVTGELGYGRNHYDYNEGTMIFAQPGQVITTGAFEMDKNSRAWTILFHPDLIRTYPLGQEIGNYSFFSYEIHEALHVSEPEIIGLIQLIRQIENEYVQRIDKHTEELIVANLEMILKYCKRYYERQFYTRSNQSKGHIVSFEKYLHEYFESGRHLEKGLPTVSECGEALNMSGHYLSDLLKVETGKSVLEHIHLYVIELAKTSLLNSSKTVGEIAYELGFEYSQNFSRLFKSKTGMSPREYRTLT